MVEGGQWRFRRLKSALSGSFAHCELDAICFHGIALDLLSTKLMRSTCPRKGIPAPFSNVSEANEWLIVIREMLCSDEGGTIVDSLLLRERALAA